MPILGVVASSVRYVMSSFEKIGTYTASGSTIDITSIPADYQHLRLIGTMADNRGVAYSGINITFNNDSGGNYWFSLLNADNRSGSVYSGSYGTTWANNFGFSTMGGVTSSGSFTCGYVMDIFDYADTSKKTTIIDKAGWGDASNGGYVIRSLFAKEAGFWNNTAAVNQMTITTPFGPFRNTEVSLYGIKD